MSEWVTAKDTVNSFSGKILKTLQNVTNWLLNCLLPDNLRSVQHPLHICFVSDVLEALDGSTDKDGMTPQIGQILSLIMSICRPDNMNLSINWILINLIKTTDLKRFCCDPTRIWECNWINISAPWLIDW